MKNTTRALKEKSFGAGEVICSLYETMKDTVT